MPLPSDRPMQGEKTATAYGGNARDAHVQQHEQGNAECSRGTRTGAANYPAKKDGGGAPSSKRNRGPGHGNPDGFYATESLRVTVPATLADRVSAQRVSGQRELTYGSDGPKHEDDETKLLKDVGAWTDDSRRN